MQLVILAAGHGRRFGGLKQLAPVGPNGEAIMDFTARAALSCGFEDVVLVVREEIEDEIAAHLRVHWPSELAVVLVRQPPRPGTAEAVLSARAVLRGPFAVANADDLYGTPALESLHRHFADARLDAAVAERHALVGYRLAQTIVGDEPVRRGICSLGPSGELEEVVEHEVRPGAGGFLARPRSAPETSEHPIDSDVLVSMNLWGFHLRMLEHLESALAAAPAHDGHELLLPDVVGALVAARGDSFQVLASAARCVGVTHRSDLAIVRTELEREYGAASPVRSGPASTP